MGEWIEIELVEEPTRQRRVALEPAMPKPARQPPEHPSRLGGGRNRRLAGIGAGVAVVAGIGWAMSRSDGDLSTSEPPATLDETAVTAPALVETETTQPRPSTTRVRVTTTTGPPIVVEQLGGPMLPTASGLQLVGLTGQGDLVDIDLDTGEMTTTDVPGGGGSEGTILASGGWTYVQRWDVSSSYIVPRGGLPVDVTSRPGMSNGVYRGPEPDTLWVLQSDPTNGQIRGLNLVGLDGEPLGRSIDLQGWWPMQSDLAGGVVVPAGGSVYIVSEAGARLMADGELVGVGLNHFLVRDCDETLSCGLFVVDRSSLERRQVPVIRVDGMAQYWGWTGTDAASVAPDGSAAIVFGLGGNPLGAALLGTDTGVYRELSAMNNGAFSVAWSDDSRYVAYAANATLVVYDSLTGETIEFGDAVPRMVSFASRP